MSYRVTQKMRTAVLDRVNDLMRQAKDLGWEVPQPVFDYGLVGTTGGKMGWDSVMYINPCLLNENWDHYLHQTVGHEFAHHIQHKHFPRSSAHGPEWKSIMVALGLPPIRTHNYNVSNAQVKKKNKFLYKCDGCGAEVILGPVRHKNQQSGKVAYTHRCRSRVKTLKFVKRLGQVSYQEARASAEKPTRSQPTNRPWKEVAVEVFGQVSSRKDFINKMVSLGCGKNTASTYHHNVKSGKWC